MKKKYHHAMRKYLIAAISMSFITLICSVLLLTGVVNKTIVALIEFISSAAVVSYVSIIAKTRRKTISKYLESITGNDMDLSENLITSVPMPMAVCSIDGLIRWYNDRFSAIFTEKVLLNESLDECIDSLKWSDVLKYPEGKEIIENTNGKVYSVHWSIIKDRMNPNQMGDHFSVFFYLNDITLEKELRESYENEKVDIAVVNIDNFDEFAQKNDDNTTENAASKIRNAVVDWSNSINGVIKKTDRDKYFVAFEHQNLQNCTKDNFSGIIDRVLKIADDSKFPLSISIGIGTGGSLSQNEASARQALDLALGRGGGQVCLKNSNDFKFFGGRNTEYEKSTRVKARAVATALSDININSDNVNFMGHSNADYDCLGAAVGLQRTVRVLNKTPYIIHEHTAPAVETMYKDLKDVEEYAGMFVDEYDVFDKVTPNTLLIVLDTHRPSMLPAPKLLDNVGKVVLIDHHRRSTEFLSPCSLIYHEPYASSTCEMVTELLEYMNTGSALTKIEAQCLYTGIIMDTKNFMLKTGVRTFEAASYLRRLGLDTAAARRMFSSRLSDYKQKAEIVSNSILVLDEVAVSKTNKSHINMRMIASQAADEMLNLEKVKASVVVFPVDGGVGVCARSLGSVNVQLIMEKLGGGGHMTVAGATIPGIDIDAGASEAIRSIKEYLNERNG